MMFLDTCVLIDYSKDKIVLNLEENYYISSIVKLEFKVGALNTRELKKINRILSKIKLLDTDQTVLELAERLIDRYVLSHNMAIYDAVIAATCLIYDIPLWTYNKKDFRYIEEIKLVDEEESQLV